MNIADSEASAGVTAARVLGDAEQARYLRQTLVAGFGPAGQKRVRDASVLVVGTGGLGSPVIQYLAAAGIGRLGLVDDDVVEETNLHRQVIHKLEARGTSKVVSAGHAARALAGDLVKIETHEVRLGPKNARDLIGGYEVVVDCPDNFPTRYLINDVAADLGRPVVWGSILGADAQVSVFWSRPPKGEGVTLRDLFPKEPEPGSVPTCAEAGVLGPLCGQAGSTMAMEALKLAAKVGRPLLGRVLIINALRATFDEIVIRPNPTEGIWADQGVRE